MGRIRKSIPKVRPEIPRVSTGVQALDDLLDGGLPRRHISILTGDHLDEALGSVGEWVDRLRVANPEARVGQSSRWGDGAKEATWQELEGHDCLVLPLPFPPAFERQVGLSMKLSRYTRRIWKTGTALVFVGPGSLTKGQKYHCSVRVVFADGRATLVKSSVNAKQGHSIPWP